MMLVVLKKAGFGTHSFPAKKIPDIINAALDAEHAHRHTHTPVLKSISSFLSSSLKTQMPAAKSTNTIKLRNNVPIPNARKLWCVYVHTGGSVRIWLVGKKSKLILHNIIF